MLILSTLGVAGQGVVTGRVADSLTGEPLYYTSVGVKGTATGTVTDEEGRYRLNVNTADSITIQFSYVGYRSVEYRVAVKGSVRLDVKLQRMAQQLEGVKIVSEKIRNSTFTQIEAAKLDDAVGPTGGVESLIKMLPDVQSNNELSSQYSVRVGSFDENLVYINGIEVFRPMLIRSAQQEGMSIINSDMVGHILFSPGGFDVTYGDKLSSVLDIAYERPREFSAKLSASLLGAAATVKGTAGEKVYYSLGLRQHSNRYVLGSLDTKGSYHTNYTDLQAFVGYSVNEKLDLSAMAIWTRNVYNLVPESATVTFGGFFMPLSLRVYFDGQEQDSYNTLLGTVMADYRPNEDWQLKGAVVAQHVPEREQYDLQSQYWLYELGMGETAGDTMMFDRGVGTFLEHARNQLTTDILTLEVKAIRQVRLGSWNLGAKVQYEQINDHLREWKWVDSAGYALPATIPAPGDSSNLPSNPILQFYTNAENSMQTLRGALHAQREVNFTLPKGGDVKLVAGVRGQVYDVTKRDYTGSHRSEFHYLVSPRLSASYKPGGKQDVVFKLATGIYRQPPFYREYRRSNGELADRVGPQTSYQVTGAADWRLKAWDRPLTITADLYYKYITDLIPYTVDNLRLRYMPDLSAVAYAVGFSVRASAELVEGLESWASLSIMQTQEDIEGDGLGWLARPTDSRVGFKLFVQDNIPTIPWWKMSLSLVYGGGTPVTIPWATRTADTYRLPAYYRADWGNTIQLSEFGFFKRSKLGQWFKDVQVGVELFNVFNFRNVVSYLWVSDYENRYYPVPNYLTARQLNFKLTVLF